MEQSRPKKSKKIFLVDRDFQLRYAKIAVYVGILTSVLTAFVILYPLYIFEILRVPKFLPLPILLAMAAVVFINVSGLAFVVVLMTHRVAGPMYSLFREIRRIGSGSFRVQLKSREKDEFSYVLRNFGEMAQSLCSKTEADIVAINDVCYQLEVEGDQANALNQLKSLKDRLASRIDA